jgi:hypothetical protein
MSQHFSYKKQHLEERKRQRRLRKTAQRKAKRATVILTPASSPDEATIV